MGPQPPPPNFFHVVLVYVYACVCVQLSTPAPFTNYFFNLFTQASSTGSLIKSRPVPILTVSIFQCQEPERKLVLVALGICCWDSDSHEQMHIVASVFFVLKASTLVQMMMTQKREKQKDFWKVGKFVLSCGLFLDGEEEKWDAGSVLLDPFILCLILTPPCDGLSLKMAIVSATGRHYPSSWQQLNSLREKKFGDIKKKCHQILFFEQLNTVFERRSLVTSKKMSSNFVL